MSDIKLPKDWMLVPISEIGKIETGTTPSKAISEYYGTEFPFYKPSDLEAGINVYKSIDGLTKLGVNKARYIPEFTTLVTCIGATIGKTGFVKKGGGFNQQINAIIPNEKSNPKFIFYQAISIGFQKQIKENASATTLPLLNKSKFQLLTMVTCSLETQQAIVSKIEELFSELDKGLDDLKTAQQQLKTYRQSVLKWAFEGKLTNEKVKDGELPKDWQLVKISEISRVVRGGSPRPAGDPKYYNGDIPFLKVADLTKDNGIYLTTYKYTIKEAGLHKTRQISPNTLLLSNSGATLGVPKICMISATMNDGVAAFLDLDERSNHYLYYFWVSKTSELRGINMGAGQPNLNTDLIKDYKVPYCSFEEQHLIVQEIESRLSVADKMEEIIAQSVQQAEALRQSILKKAFSGELV